MTSCAYLEMQSKCDSSDGKRRRICGDGKGREAVRCRIFALNTGRRHLTTAATLISSFLAATKASALEHQHAFAQQNVAKLAEVATTSDSRSAEIDGGAVPRLLNQEVEAEATERPGSGPNVLETSAPVFTQLQAQSRMNVKRSRRIRGLSAGPDLIPSVPSAKDVVGDGLEEIGLAAQGHTGDEGKAKPMPPAKSVWRFFNDTRMNASASFDATPQETVHIFENGTTMKVVLDAKNGIDGDKKTRAAVGPISKNRRGFRYTVRTPQLVWKLDSFRVHLFNGKVDGPRWNGFKLYVDEKPCPRFHFKYVHSVHNKTIEKGCRLIGSTFQFWVPERPRTENFMSLAEVSFKALPLYECQCDNGKPSLEYCGFDGEQKCQSCNPRFHLRDRLCHKIPVEDVARTATNNLWAMRIGVAFGAILLVYGTKIGVDEARARKTAFSFFTKKNGVETDPDIKPPEEEDGWLEEGDHTKWEEEWWEEGNTGDEWWKDPTQDRWDDGYHQAAAVTGTTASQGAADARRVVDGTLDIGSSLVSGTGKVLYGAADLTGQAVMGTASVVGDVATGTANVAATGAMYTGNAVVSGTSAAVDATGSALMYTGGAVVGATTAVGGAAIDGTMAVGGAAISGTKYVGGAVVDGTSAVVDGTGSAIMYTGGAVAGGVGAVGDRWDERRRNRFGESGGSGKHGGPQEFPEKSASKKGTKKGGFVASGGKGVKGKGPKKGAPK